MKKTNIVVAGIGGVGGFFGGMLAKAFQTDEDIAINFLARGAHLKEIQQNGLKVISKKGDFIAHPKLATDNAAEFGLADYIIVCTKGYDLEATIEQLQPCIDTSTIILPLLNGVDSRAKIKGLLPDNLVLDGFVFIITRLIAAGVIENSGTKQLLYFGLDNYENERLDFLDGLFKKAGIESNLTKNISSFLWEKFLFISPLATTTSYHDCTIGDLLEDPQKFKTFTDLLEELLAVAKAKGIVLVDDIREQTFNRLLSSPFGATSSMHSDFKSKKGKTELDSLTAYVCREGEKFGLEMPVYERAYKRLNSGQ